MTAPLPDTAPANATQQIARATAVGVAVAALAIVAVLLLAVRPDWWRAFAAASVVSVAGAAASVPVVAFGVRHGPRRPELVMASYLAALMARGVIMVGGAMAAILLGRYPLAATLLMIVPYYLSILAAETIVVTRLLLAQPGAEPLPDGRGSRGALDGTDATMTTTATTTNPAEKTTHA